VRTDWGAVRDSPRTEFEEFVRQNEPSLRRALVAAYGFERGRDATAEALGWAWENWGKARLLDHRVAYLFRVGQSKSRQRREPVTFTRNEANERWFDPGLTPVLESLSEHQRIAVVLINGFEWRLREVAELLEVRDVVASLISKIKFLAPTPGKFLGEIVHYSDPLFTGITRAHSGLSRPLGTPTFPASWPEGTSLTPLPGSLSAPKK
jgi:hypothetical protein